MITNVKRTKHLSLFRVIKHLTKSSTRKLRECATKHLWYSIGVFVVLALLILSFIPMLSGTVVQFAPVAFTTHTVQDPNIELGNTQTEQAGTNGTQKVTYSEPKSVFNAIFGGGEEDKLIERTITVTKQPVQEIIDSGTLKYQYMYCSNGNYRYYTDTQFKNPTTGFTHKSPDYCAQNHEGTETQLADTPPKQAAAATPSIAPISSLSVPDCTTTSIPYGIDYQNVSWLPEGQTETFPGLDGTYFSCLGTTVQPLNEIVDEGTGQNYDAESQEEAQSLAEQKCTDEYNSAMAQIDEAGAAGSSASIELQQLYSECLDGA